MAKPPNNPWTVSSFIELESKLVRILRAHRSQEQVNRKIGFKEFNGIAKIEHGRRRILWQEFVKLCACCHLDLVSILRGIDLPLRERQNPFKDEGKFVQLLTSGYPATSFSRVQGWPTSKLSRLKGGQTPLKLIDVLAILARNDEPFLGLIRALTGSGTLAMQLGFASAGTDAERQMSDPWIGVFYSLLELKEIRGAEADKSAVRSALCSISGMSVEELDSWLYWMIEQGWVVEDADRYRPALHQGSFHATLPTLSALHSRVGTHLAANRALPPEERQPGAVNFQFLVANPETLRAMGIEMKALREKLHTLSRECLRNGSADRVVIAETVILDPAPTASK